MTIEELAKELAGYDGRPLTLMEVCGSHTAAITKSGIRQMLSDRIRLVSGPGCPVCVTPTAYIDRLVELALTENTCVVSFGDLLRVPGSQMSLSQAKGKGARTQMVYSPMETLELAKKDPATTYVFAAVGFETTAPVYTLLLEEALREKIKNIRLLTSLKVMPPAIDYLMSHGAAIDGFLAPGHVAAVTGSDYFKELSAAYGIPFVVSGFEDEELLIAIYRLVKLAEAGTAAVENAYPSVVEAAPNPVAAKKLRTYFEPCDATWRGMGEIKDSGLKLREEYMEFDAGSMGLDSDAGKNPACHCGQILMGKEDPGDCPLFGKVCTPQNPQGACMVSYEGSCFTAISAGI